MILRWVLSLVLNAIALLAVNELFEAFSLDGFWAALLASFILSILNVIVKPILIVLTLPITVLSLGLFLFVVNAITLMLTQAIMGSSFVIEGFGTAIVAAVILAVLNLLLNKLIRDTITAK